MNCRVRLSQIGGLETLLQRSYQRINDQTQLELANMLRHVDFLTDVFRLDNKVEGLRFTRIITVC